MRTLLTIDIANAPSDRALTIARQAAEYIQLGEDSMEAYEADCAHAWGCAPEEVQARLWVLQRAWRLAEQHRAGGPKFRMIEEALEDLTSA